MAIQNAMPFVWCYQRKKDKVDFFKRNLQVLGLLLLLSFGSNLEFVKWPHLPRPHKAAMPSKFSYKHHSTIKAQMESSGDLITGLINETQT